VKFISEDLNPNPYLLQLKSTYTLLINSNQTSKHNKNKDKLEKKQNLNPNSKFK